MGFNEEEYKYLILYNVGDVLSGVILKVSSK